MVYRNPRCGLDEGVEPEAHQRLPKLRERVGGEDDGGILAAPASEPLRVKMVSVEMADVEVVGRPKGLMIKAVISRVWKPACVVRRIEPRITEDRTVRGMDLHASLSDEFDPHGEEDTRLPSRSCSVSRYLHHITIIIGSTRGSSHEASEPPTSATALVRSPAASAPATPSQPQLGRTL